jgi:hypothetical protein
MSLFNTPTAKDMFNEFASDFTKRQKSAILSFVSVVIWADSPMNLKEETQMKDILKVLCIDESRLETEIDFIKDWDDIAKVLGSLSNSHVNWLIVTIHNLMLCDGPANDKEVAIVEAMFSKIDVDDKRYIEEVQKANALMNHFLRK